MFNFSSLDFLERKPVAVDEKAAGVFISQSGKTAEVLASMRWFKEQGGATTGLTQKTESLRAHILPQMKNLQRSPFTCVWLPIQD